MADEVVAWFEVRFAGVNPFDTQGDCIEVCGNEQFYLGRDTELCRYSWTDDLTISRKHLRIHCVLYEQDPVAHIAPFVYATDLSANGTYLKKSNPACSGSQGQGIWMGNQDSFLMEPGDELRLSDTVTLVYFPATLGREASFSNTQQREKASFASRYLITGRMLGEGGYGKVLVAVNQETQRQLACKVVAIGRLYDSLVVADCSPPIGELENRKKKSSHRWPAKVSSCFREFDILKDLSHPNVVTLEKVFWSPDTIYLFQELIAGGDLFSFLEYKGGRLSSLLSARIIHQVLKGVDYLHARNIVHRDLKPDNILMASLEDGARVVITDFGNARPLPNDKSSCDGANKYQRMFSYVGTLEFAAPEIHKANKTIPANAGYSKSVDMWSIGSITATLLTGDVIFTDRTHPKYEKDPRTVIMTLAGRCDLSILDDKHHPIWSGIDAHPKHFIKRLLRLQEDDRMTAPEALIHPWFSSFSENFEEQYACSIQDWTPREHSLELVERVSAFVSGLSKSSRPNKSSDGASTTDFFTSLEQRQTQSVGSLVKNQRFRADTPLPSIWEDYEDYQYSSHLKTAQEMRKVLTEQWNTHIPTCEYGRSFDDPSDGIKCSGGYSHVARIPDERPARSAASEISKFAETRERARNYVDDDSEVENPPNSLTIASNSFSQRGQGKETLQLQTSGTCGSVQVDETPLAEQFLLENGLHDVEEDDEDDLHPDFPVQWQRNAPVEVEQDSILVHETPPDRTKYQSTSHGDSFTHYCHENYQPSLGNGKRIVHPEHRKRRKMSQTCA